MASRSRYETRILLAFSASMLVVTGLAAVTWKMAENATSASMLVARTQEVLGNLARIGTDTLQIEVNTQSYRISGDAARLVERDAAIARRKAQLDQVTQLTSDNPQQQAPLLQLNQVIEERLALSRQIEQLRKFEGVEAANAFAAKAPLQETRERTLLLLNLMEAEERRLLGRRIAGQLQAKNAMVAVGALASLVLLALLIFSYVFIRRQDQEAETSRRVLAESEESLSKTLHSLGDAVLATDGQGRIVRMNPVAERLTGWVFPLAQGQSVENVFRIVDAHTRQSLTVPVAELLTGEMQEANGDTVLIARDGSEHPISHSMASIRNITGEAGGVVVVFRDVSVLRRAERMVRQQNDLLEQSVSERTAELAASRDQLNSVINNVPVLIAYVDQNQHYTYVNTQYRERFAPGLADIKGLTVREVLGPERYAIASPFIAKALRGMPHSYDWQPFPGVWQIINYLPTRDAQNQVTGYFVLGLDITERKQAEEKIRSLNADLGSHIRKLERSARALKTLSTGYRTMMRATNEQDLLDCMCRDIVEAGGYPVAAVWYRVMDESKTLLPMASVGYQQDPVALRQLKITWADNDERGQGVVARAIRDGRTHVVPDMLADPNYAVWLAHLGGLASGIACPLRVEGEVIGALAVFSKEPHAIGGDEAPLLTELADDLAFGIAALRSRQGQGAQGGMHQPTPAAP